MAGLNLSAGPSSNFNLFSGKYGVGVSLGAQHISPSGKHVDGLKENNLGLILTAEVNPKILPDTEVQVAAYQSSYSDMQKYRGDIAVVAGVNYDPLKVDVGPLRLKAGLMGGVAYTTHGSYADAAPRLSSGKFTALGGLHAGVEHRASGLSLEATVIPSPKATAVGFILRKTF